MKYERQFAKRPIKYKKKLQKETPNLKEQIKQLKIEYDRNGPTKEPKAEIAYDRLKSFRKRSQFLTSNRSIIKMPKIFSMNHKIITQN